MDIVTKASRFIEGLGTPEAAWLASEGLRKAPLVPGTDLVPEGSRMVIVAPHPDDEVLPCGGLLYELNAAGRECRLIAVTDGEASHPESAVWTPERLRAERAHETVMAWQKLHVLPRIERLRLPDGGVEEDPLLAVLRPLIRAGDVLFCPWRLDGHPDHEVTASACIEAAVMVGASVVEMPVWGWHWSVPDDSPMPWESAVRVALSPAARQAKREAMACFRSQITADRVKAPVLTSTTLARFERPFEVYFR